MADNIRAKHSKKTATSTVMSGEGYYFGFTLGTDGVNDPEVTIFDNTAASGNEIVPTTTYDASALGLNGMLLANPVHCLNGIHVELSAAGTKEIVIYYRLQSELSLSSYR